MKKLILIFCTCVMSFSVYAQVKLGDNPTVIDVNSVLEIESSQRGLLLPRLELTSTDLALPMTRHVQGMFIYNTATTADVTPGVYYNDGIKWRRVANTTEVNALIDSVNTGSGSILTGTGAITVTGNGTLSNPYLISVNEVDGDSTNEIQSLSLSGNLLQISNNPSASPVNLSAFNQSAAVIALGQRVDTTNFRIDSLGLNMDTIAIQIDTINNQIININNQISSISSNDNDSTNELQDLTLTGNLLQLTNSPSGNAIDLTPYDQSIAVIQLGYDIDTLTNQIAAINSNDNDSTNELQSLSYVNGVLSISQGNSINVGQDGDAWGVIGEDLTTSIYRSGKVSIGTAAAQPENLHVEGGSLQKIMSVRGPLASSEVAFVELGASNWPSAVSTVLSTSDGMRIDAPEYSNLIFNIRNNDTSDGIHFVSSNGTKHILTANAAGRVGIGIDFPKVTLDLATAPRTGFYNYTTKAAYLTGNIGTLDNGFEFLRSDQTQGIGIGSEGLYATGSFGGGAIKLRAQSSGWVHLQPNGGATGEIIIQSGRIYPNDDNLVYLGAGNKRFKALYAVNGTIQTSDARLKTNVRPLQYGIEDVMKLKPVVYDWKSGEGDDNLGFLAQELREVVPNVVVGDEKIENLSVKYAELIPVLTKAIQDQQREIEKLKSQNDQLTDNNQQLRADISNIQMILERNGLISTESTSK